MSWSVNGAGKASEVKEKIKADGAGITYLEGDEAKVKDAALALLDQALGSTDSDRNVTVSAGGHADIVDGKQVKQNINISIY